MSPNEVIAAAARNKLSLDEVWKSGEFLIKLCDVTSDEKNITACLRAVRLPGTEPESSDPAEKRADVILSADSKLDTITLGDLRMKVPSRSFSLSFSSSAPFFVIISQKP